MWLPWNERVVLLVDRIADFPISTGADPAEGSVLRAPVLVLVGVAQDRRHRAVLQSGRDVGQIAPIRSCLDGDEGDAGLHQGRHQLANVIPQDGILVGFVVAGFAAGADGLLEGGERLAAVGDLLLLGAVGDFRQIGHCVADRHLQHAEGFRLVDCSWLD